MQPPTIPDQPAEGRPAEARPEGPANQEIEARKFENGVSEAVKESKEDAAAPAPAPRKLSGWSAVVKGGSSSSSNQAAPSASDPATTDAKPNAPQQQAHAQPPSKTAGDGDKPGGEGGSAATVAAAAAAAGPGPTSPAVHPGGEADSAAATATPADASRSGESGGGEGGGGGESTPEASKPPAKPAWKKPEPSEAAAPLVPDWPTLVDAKQPLKKKERASGEEVSTASVRALALACRQFALARGWASRRHGHQGVQRCTLLRVLRSCGRPCACMLLLLFFAVLWQALCMHAVVAGVAGVRQAWCSHARCCRCCARAAGLVHAYCCCGCCCRRQAWCMHAVPGSRLQYTCRSGSWAAVT